MPAATRRKKIAAPDSDRLAALFASFQAANPAPTTELHFASPFQLLIAVILSAQTTDRAVNLATRPLFARCPDPAALLALGEAGLAEAIKTIGLYKTKARHVIATCRQLIDRHGGAVPSSREALEALPGVGRKTANVVLNTAFGQPTLAVDTHIFRLAHRLGLSDGKTPLAAEQDLLRQIPEAYLKDAHHWLILHGRYICKARRPECWRCPVSALCPFTDKTPAPGTAVPLDLNQPAAAPKRQSERRTPTLAETPLSAKMTKTAKLAKAEKPTQAAKASRAAIPATSARPNISTRARSSARPKVKP